MFYGSTTDMTDSELAGNAALCRDILRTGYINGILIDADGEDYFAGWLSDIESEIAARDEAE